ncbi:MAG: YjdF family protein [Oscillospiraceae bacterium]|nr:YjdF family protein [Oscillospiraceae bacterium]
MAQDSIRLTVFFEDPFWVGVFERVADGRLSACKVTFGAEPKDHEVWELVRREYAHLKFSPAVEAEKKPPDLTCKKLHKLAKRQTRQTGVGTKSQQALQMQREQQKTERRRLSREQREAEKQRLFALKRQKRKEKHRGH